MKEILDTTLIESDKSSFLIDLVKHESGKFYISITQTIINSNPIEKHEIKINQNIAEQIIKVLNQYKNQKESSEPKGITVPTKPEEVRKKKLTSIEEKQIQERYLKGMEIEIIASQFYCSASHIETLLRTLGLAIVSNKVPPIEKKKFKRRWRK